MITYLKNMIFLVLFSCVISESACADTETIVLASVNAPESKIYQLSEAVLQEAFRRNGLNVILKNYPAKRAAMLADGGKVDGESHRVYDFNKDNKYPNLIRVEVPVQSVEQSVFTRKTEFKVDGWKSLAPYRVIYIGGIEMAEKGLKGAVEEKNLIPVYEMDTAFKMLAMDRGDVLISSPETGFAAIKKLSLENSGIKMLSPPILVIDLYTYLHKRHSGLAVKIAASLKEMKADGTYRTIIERFKK